VSTHLLLEAAARSLVMGAIILVALRLMRIEQVRARRTAWLLALAGALAMPFLVNAQIGPRLLPDFASVTARATQTVAPAAVQPVAEPAAEPAPQTAAQPQGLRSVYGDYRGPLSESRSGMMRDSRVLGGTPAAIEDNRDDSPLADAALSLAVLGYCVVAAVLSLRLCAGVGFALRLRNQAERVTFPFDPELDVRTTSRVASPVTIGSSVLLPGNYTAWDATTLRIVLSHERAHVRQKDFLIHALAGLHCALFWFNPFSWWLQRQLAELGEALSDCAAVKEAESRTGYAEILLAFATRARWPLTAVAMASASNLTPRIERLLNDQGFERSFAPTQRLPFIAAGVVALAMFASTSMVRVHASPIDNATASNPPAPPSALPAPNAPTAADTATPTAPSVPTPAAPTTPAAPPALRPPASPAIAQASPAIEHDAVAKDEEGVLVIHSGHSGMMFDAGDRLPSQSGDYIYFQHNGKPYLIQDPQIIAKAQAVLAPIKLLDEKQRSLGNQQSMLDVQQRMLGSQERTIKLAESPEFKHQMAELQKTIKELDLPRLTAQIDQHALAEVQAHLGEIQARVAELQMQFGLQQGQFGEQMSKLGEQQGKLGEQEAMLGEQQRKIIEDVRRQLKPIIEQAIREGKGKLIWED
jgi:beta-lactamase regulating signal transducer with metallopeptidase domain